MEQGEQIDRKNEHKHIRTELDNLANEIHESIDQTISKTDKGIFNPYGNEYGSGIYKNPKY